MRIKIIINLRRLLESMHIRRPIMIPLTRLPLSLYLALDLIRALDNDVYSVIGRWTLVCIQTSLETPRRITLITI